jgi:hypothetical protein
MGQWFVLQLLKQQGLVPLSQDGSPFISRLLTGRVSTETDIFLALTSSIGTVVKNLRALELPTDSPDEQLATVQIVRFSLSAGSAVAILALISKGGAKVMVPLPLNFATK